VILSVETLSRLCRTSPGSDKSATVVDPTTTSPRLHLKQPKADVSKRPPLSDADEMASRSVSTPIWKLSLTVKTDGVALVRRLTRLPTRRERPSHCQAREPCRSGHQSWLRAGLWVRDSTAGPAATGTRRLAGPRREAQDELGCGERSPRPSGAPAGSICAALREALKAATVLIEGDDPRIKHCRASHLAACGHTVLPKIGPVIALRRRTDYQSPDC
jgi:hypothetical protein